MPSMQTSDVTPERLQRLAALEAPGGARILSLYLNLDPSANFGAPANRQSATTSLMDSAYRAVEAQDDLDHRAHIALREDVARAREALDANLDDGWAEGAHALGMFVSGPAGLFDVIRLPRAVDSRVVIAEKPAIEPLAETGPVEPWAVVVMDGDDARIFEGLGDRLVVIEHPADDHDKRTSHAWRSGSMRYASPVGKEEAEFLASVAADLCRLDRDRNFRRILVGATARHLGVFEEKLEPHTRAKIIGHFDAGADWENAQDIRQKVEPLLQMDETRREADALARAAYPGVRGLEATLPALYERRVDTLLIEPGLEHRGIVCPRCRWAAADERGECPVDGVEMKPCENLVEWAVELAVAQDATVLPVRHHNDLSEHDGIGAALRF
jgi:hypothetical protein